MAKRRVFINKSGFMLLEAVLTVVIVSICSTFIVQALLTNYRTGVRFQGAVQSLMAMENRLAILFATGASEDQMSPYPQPLEKPYSQFVVSTRREAVNDHLNKVGLLLDWPAGKTRLEVTTIIYNPVENPGQN